MQTIHQFIKKYGVTISNKRADSNPHLKDDRGDMHHWRCTLRVKGSPAHITIPFSQGYAHPEEPTAADVLSCVALDASMARDARDAEDLASDLGMELEIEGAYGLHKNPKVKRLYTACMNEATKLEYLFGKAGAEELMYDTEPL